MASVVPFRFDAVRKLQKSSPEQPEPNAYADFNHQDLRQASSLLRSKDRADIKMGLSLCDGVIEEAMSSDDTEGAVSGRADSPSASVTKHQALLLRSDLNASSPMQCFAKAVSDLEQAIILRPNYVDAYRKLCDAEASRKQFGRAEVAILLGLRVDPENVELKKRQSDVRKQDSVYHDVRGIDGSDRIIRDRMHQAGRDLHPPNIHPLVMCIMHGNLRQLKAGWRPELRDFRHGDIENPLMHFPVLGAQRITPVNPDPDSGKRMLQAHKDIIDFLFDQGLRLDARDKCGYTALMHAAGHQPQPELLEHLLANGADPNLKSVYGTVALMDASMNQNLTEIDILLRHEADAHIADNDGMTPEQFGKNFRKVAAVYRRHLIPAVMPARLCERCSEKGTKRCTKCRVVYYCGKECQVGDWANHKSRCKKLCKSHKRVAVSEDKYFVELPDFKSLIMQKLVASHQPNYQPEPVELETGLYEIYNDEWQKSGNLFVKIQALLNPDDFSINMDGKLLVYNEKRNFRCSLDPHKLQAKELLAIIRDRGVDGAKGYFWAFMEAEKPTELIVITDPVHPAQPW